MRNGNIIIGVFVKKFRILSFLEFLHNKMGIKTNRVFIFNVEKNDSEYLVTFSANKENQYFLQLHDVTVLHVKNGCLFSINALNMFINSKKGSSVSNKDYPVDWEELKNKLLIVTNGTYRLLNLSKIENKCNLLGNLS